MTLLTAMLVPNLQASALSLDVKKGVEILLSFGLLQTYGDDVKAYESLEVSNLLGQCQGYIGVLTPYALHRTLFLVPTFWHNPRHPHLRQKLLYHPLTFLSMFSLHTLTRPRAISNRLLV